MQNGLRILKIFNRILEEVHLYAKKRYTFMSIPISPEATEKEEVNLTALNLSELELGDLIMHLLMDTIYTDTTYAKMDYIPMFEIVRKNDDELQLYISRGYIERISGYF